MCHHKAVQKRKRQVKKKEKEKEKKKLRRLGVRKAQAPHGAELLCGCATRLWLWKLLGNLACPATAQGLHLKGKT